MVLPLYKTTTSSLNLDMHSTRAKGLGVFVFVVFIIFRVIQSIGFARDICHNWGRRRREATRSSEKI